MRSYSFADSLIALRKRNRITQRQLAFKLKISDKTVSKWENGISIPKAEDLVKIADFFGITLDELLSDVRKKHHLSDAESAFSLTEDVGNERDPLSDIVTTDIDLIPKDGCFNGSYFCTWCVQGDTAKALNLVGSKLSERRDALNENTLFDSEGFYHKVPYAMRGDIAFVLDDGWDVPYGTPNDSAHRKVFGSLDPDREKFASFGKTPEERLRGISEKLKEMGYAGLGLWVSPQQFMEEEYTEEGARAYWEERARWCHNAGVLYWKVDWGMHSNNKYRRLISECAKKYAPELIVEHAVVQMPIESANNDDSFRERRIESVKYQLEFCDAYRTYDVLSPFDNVCTLARAAEALSVRTENTPTGKGLINAESQATVAAALGLTVGIMGFDTDMHACLAWHRLSPPFSVHGTDSYCSEADLEDTAFCDNEFCTWISCKGQTVTESAPAIITRNCPPPTVSACADTLPFVIASKNPITNAYSVATVPRTVDPNRGFYPLADVEIRGADPEAPIGIFGVFNTLTVNFTKAFPNDARILVQDLTSSRAIDVTELVLRSFDSLILNGKLLRLFGKWERAPKDTSTPSLVLKIF